MGYRVSAGYVTVETAVPGGRAQIDIPRGASLPDDVPAEQVETLLAQGRIEAMAKVQPDVYESPSATSDRPAARASKADWVEYAVSVGLEREEADALTKAELIDSLGE